MSKLKFISAAFLMFLVSCGATKTTATADGSSVQNAIKVKSVDEEYQIVRRLCPECKMNSQALISEGKKHYDVLYLTKPDGQIVSYYFDINSFYGQW
jgi:hypothetical protein